MIRALVTVIAVGAAPLAAAQMPTQFHGKWVPAKASCESSLGVTVTADRLAFFNGKDTESIGGIEMAGPGYHPPGYRGIEIVAITEFSGHQPVTATFNASEKKGVGRLDYSPVMPGKPTPQLNAYNARISKLNLTKRFPLNNAPLKRCAK